MEGRGTMQSVILELQRFWAERGCLIWQPYYSQVGAGTMNPATFLRVLGPEPWRVAYVEPSIRPDDARYGENPNRLQQHYQFQVILKPDPGNPQEIYLQSLQAIGVDPARHDIRFVEDKWEAPALGAWGLGWEVWLDGQEITQFTYFQQAGGELLDPVSVEITYGLERILIGMLSLEHFKDIPWNKVLRYGDLLLQSEAEQSRYYLEQADIGRMSGLFALHEEEARAALEHGLVLPAYDNLLRCSHLFNVLDARGAVGVTERAALFARMRDLSRSVSEKYIDQRRQLEFPWLRQTETSPVAAPPAEVVSPPTTPQDFLLEIGTEELPAGDLTAALATLAERAPVLFEQLRLDHRGLRVSGTPRRLIVEAAGLAPTQGEAVEMVKGPPEARAFDSAGSPTQAALGWARKQGLDSTPESLRAMVKDLEGGRYLAAEVRRGGLPTATVLARDLLPRLIESVGFDQTMRWIGEVGDSEETIALRRTAFARPIRWLIALHGGCIVPFSFAGLQAGRRTRSLRFVEPGILEIETPAAYRESLASQGILVGPDERRRRIVEQAKALASEVRGELDADASLLDEVTNLVEAPHALRGDFDPSFLSLPDEVLAAVMKKHQRYFPVRGRDGKLLPHFVVVRNGGPQGLETIRAGNEHVLRARFADADFFLRKDSEGNAELFRSRTALVTFQARLGSMLDKTERIESLVPDIAAKVVHLEGEAFESAVRTAHLCKADLATAMVTEMTSLQGVIGRIYARQWGEPEAVAQAIYEHHLPRFGGDALPESPAGIAVGLADRIDTLAGLFAAGLQPTGTRDPFALRRTAIGLIEILVARGLRADLRLWLEQAGQGLPIPLSQASLQACLQFIAARHEALLLADGRRYDVVAAVLAAQGQDPAGAAAAVADLEVAVSQPGWPPVLQAYARCARIIPRPTSSDPREGRGIVRGQKVDGRIEPELLEMEAERVLLAAAEKIAPPASVDELVTSLRTLVPPITEFFEKVLVMDEDPAKRANRLALVQRVVALADGLADLSKLEGF